MLRSCHKWYCRILCHTGGVLANCDIAFLRLLAIPRELRYCFLTIRRELRYCVLEARATANELSGLDGAKMRRKVKQVYIIIYI